jgi:hypothetical protein
LFLRLPSQSVLPVSQSPVLPRPPGKKSLGESLFSTYTSFGVLTYNCYDATTIPPSLLNK